MTRILRSTLTGAIAAVALTAAACNRDAAVDDETRTAPGTVDQPAAAPAPGATLRVTDVALGRAMRGDTAVVEEVGDFKPADTIHAVVKHEGAATEARLTARWTFQDGQVVDERTETISPTGTGATYTHFQISKPGGWPTGNYKLTLLLNGQEVESEDFEIGT